MGDLLDQADQAADHGAFPAGPRQLSGATRVEILQLDVLAVHMPNWP